MIAQLYRLDLLSAKGLYYLGGSFLRDKSNLLALVRHKSKLNGDAVAIQDELSAITYKQLYNKAKALAAKWQSAYSVNNHTTLVFLVRNSVESLTALVAASCTGCTIHFLNPDMSQAQLESYLSQHPQAFVIDTIKKYKFSSNRLLSLKTDSISRPLISRNMGKMLVLSSGTSGTFKKAERTSKANAFLAPFFALIKTLKLDQQKNALITAPLYHGYGLAASIMCLTLGKQIFYQEKLIPERLSQFNDGNIDLIIGVPTALGRIADNAQDLKVRMILTGGAAMSEHLYQKLTEKYGHIIYNLYGTSESGFVCIAAPQHLKNNPKTIGKTIRGVKYRLNKEGILELKTGWSMSSKKGSWISTGDLAGIDNDGLITLKGRSDDMIVSGGENVYLFEIEDTLKSQDWCIDCKCVKLEDKEFGQRYDLFITTTLNYEDDIKVRMQELFPRYAQAKQIHIQNDLKFNDLGKFIKPATDLQKTEDRTY